MRHSRRAALANLAWRGSIPYLELLFGEKLANAKPVAPDAEHVAKSSLGWRDLNTSFRFTSARGLSRASTRGRKGPKGFGRKRTHISREIMRAPNCVFVSYVVSPISMCR